MQQNLNLSKTGRLGLQDIESERIWSHHLNIFSEGDGKFMLTLDINDWEKQLAAGKNLILHYFIWHGNGPKYEEEHSVMVERAVTTFKKCEPSTIVVLPSFGPIPTVPTCTTEPLIEKKIAKFEPVQWWGNDNDGENCREPPKVKHKSGKLGE